MQRLSARQISQVGEMIMKQGYRLSDAYLAARSYLVTWCSVLVSLGYLASCYAGGETDSPPSRVKLGDVNTTRLAPRLATASEAASLRACASTLAAAGFGALQGRVVATGEGHFVLLTTRHILLVDADTCAQQGEPSVLADVVQSTTQRASLAQIISNQNAGTAATSLPYTNRPGEHA
jgi:hypothetical protein